MQNLLTKLNRFMILCWLTNSMIIFNHQQVLAEWIFVTDDGYGDNVLYINNNYLKVKDNPDIIVTHYTVKLYHAPTANDKGVLIAINCKNQSYTYHVTNNQGDFILPKPDDWLSSQSQNMEYFLIKTACN